MRRGRALFLVSVLMALSGVDLGAADAGFVLITNSANPVSELSADAVARFYLKKSRKWPNGGGVTPVDQSATSFVRTAFTREVLGRTIGEMRDYWLKQTLSGADVPPVSRGADADVIEFVAQDAGAIAYVSAAAKLPAEVKALRVTR
jgi:ABC-type phosphate transport system substrate-binding protein